jgi:hypothetical protein
MRLTAGTPYQVMLRAISSQRRENKMNTVYMIYNEINDKAYIGVTTQDNPRHRLYEHISRYRRGDRDHKLYQAMRKHGAEAFSVTLLCSVFRKEDLSLFEVAFIDYYDTFENGYNMTRGGDTVSAETKAKISKALTGRKITWYDKIVASRWGNPNARSPKEYVPTGAKSALSVAYAVRFPDGRTETFRGLRAFCRVHKLSHNLLLTTLSGKQTHHKGFVLLDRFNDYPEREYTQASGNGAHPILAFDVSEFV